MPPCEDTCLLKELSRTRRSQGHVRASALPVADLLASVCRPRSYLLGGLTILIPYFYLFLKSSLAMSGLCSYRATASENGTCLANGIGAEAATAPRCGVSAPAASHWGVVVTTKNTSTAYKNCEKKLLHVHIVQWPLRLACSYTLHVLFTRSRVRGAVAGERATSRQRDSTGERRETRSGLKLPLDPRRVAVH